MKPGSQNKKLSRIERNKEVEASFVGRSSKVRVGLLVDWNANRVLDSFVKILQFAFEDAMEEGLLDRPVELIVREVDGLPVGNVHNVLTAWKELADEGVVLIIGPHISENCMAIKHYIETQGRVPSIGWAGSDRWQGPWTFALNQGSLVEEGALLTNFLAHRGVRTVATVTEETAIGQEYLYHFRAAAAVEGIQVMEDIGVSQVQVKLDDVARRLRQIDPGAIAVFGFGVPVNALNQAILKLKWDPLRVVCSGFMTTPLLPGGMAGAKGMHGVDLYDETNPLGQEFLDRFSKRHGYRPANYFGVTAYDLGNVVAHALATAAPLAPEGMKEALERVKFLPAVSGGPRTLISFAPQVRRGWMGPDYLVLRQAVDREGDMWSELPNVFSHRMTPRLRAERLKAKK